MENFDSPVARAPFAMSKAPELPSNLSDTSSNATSPVAGSSRVNVFARVRPLLQREEDIPEVVEIINDQHLVVTNGPNDREQRYQLDHVFTPDATQQDVYSLLEPSINDCFDGYNTTIFAYGQTGTGKTHTVLGLNLWEMAEKHAESMEGGGVATFDPQEINAQEEMWGLIPRAGRAIFSEIAQQEKETEGQVKFEVKCTYLELYNERLYDLFKEDQDDESRRSQTNRGLEIRQDKMQGVFVPNATSVPVHSEHELLGLLWEGAKHRAISATDMNAYSSRSHTILQIQITRKPISDVVLPKYALIKRAKLNIIDLAGSETMKRNKISKFTDQRIAELTSINQSLSCLGNCIRALEKGSAHVPYRDSKLTRLLEDSLGGNTKTTFIVTVSSIQKTKENQKKKKKNKKARKETKIQLHATLVF